MFTFSSSYFFLAEFLTSSEAVGPIPISGREVFIVMRDLGHDKVAKRRTE